MIYLIIYFILLFMLLAFFNGASERCCSVCHAETPDMCVCVRGELVND